MRYLITGAAGFIGSNFVRYINDKEPDTSIWISDYLTNGIQYKNLLDVGWDRLIHPDDIKRSLDDVDYVFHFGGISSTTEWCGDILFDRNYKFTIDLINECVSKCVPIQYSSSASVYGNDGVPLNLYAFFKKLVDSEVSKMLKYNAVVQGFRYFNVYGPNEWHKGNMASPHHQFTEQAKEYGIIKVFEGSENFYRDFVPVERVCEIQFKMMNEIGGIYDIGSGIQRSFLEVANEIASIHNAKVETIPFPKHLIGHYQTDTKADMSYLNDIL